MADYKITGATNAAPVILSVFLKFSYQALMLSTIIL